MSESSTKARQLLADAMTAGLTFAECVAAFAAGAGDEKLYADYARKHLTTAGRIEVDEPTVVSLGDDSGAYVMAWIWVDDKDVCKGPTDSDGEPCRFVNHYHCQDCDEAWTDQWSCACDDRCPACDTEIEPAESVELDLAGIPKEIGACSNSGLLAARPPAAAKTERRYS